MGGSTAGKFVENGSTGRGGTGPLPSTLAGTGPLGGVGRNGSTARKFVENGSTGGGTGPLPSTLAGRVAGPLPAKVWWSGTGPLRESFARTGPLVESLVGTGETAKVWPERVHCRQVSVGTGPLPFFLYFVLEPREHYGGVSSSARHCRRLAAAHDIGHLLVHSRRATPMRAVRRRAIHRGRPLPHRQHLQTHA